MSYTIELEYKFGMKANRHACPACGKPKSFTRFVDCNTGQLLPEEYGFCRRKDNCGYFKTVKDYFANGPVSRTKYSPRIPAIKKSVISIHENQLVADSIENPNVSNTFVSYLLSKIPEAAVYELVKRFHIGTLDHEGRMYCIWWQIDERMRVRAGKCMLYDRVTGLRIKNGSNAITWMHKAIDHKNFTMSSCLFGLHQLCLSNGTVCITESEKTAVVCSYFWPQFIWMSSGGFDGLTEEKLEPLQGRDVILHADKGCGVRWAEKVDRFMKVNRKLRLRMADGLPDSLPDGSDLVDLLIYKGKM